MRRASMQATGFLFCLWAACTDARSQAKVQASHDLTYDSNGKLVFTQVKSEASASMKHSALYPVEVNFDIEEMDTKAGVTMIFDKQNHVLRLDPGLSKTDGLVWGTYSDEISQNGWSELYVEQSTCPDSSNDVKMFASGFIEGILTCVRMSHHYANMHDLVLKDSGNKASLNNIKKLFKNEDGFMKFKANLSPHVMTEEPDDVYWKHARYVLFQMWGVLDGYNFAANHFNVHKLEAEDMLLLNAGGALPELIKAFAPAAVASRAAAALAAATVPSFLQQNSKSLRGRATKMVNATEDPLDDAHWEQRVAKDGHCSALVRVTEGNADLLMGHTTWGDYSSMTRIFKYYNFHLLGAETMAQHIAFPSYPGAISSTDSFYEMDSGLAVTETTLELLNPFIYDKEPEFPLQAHLPNFVHVMVTNRLAKTAAHWANIYTSMSPGTYSSQWLVVDYNTFVPGQPIAENTLWVVESVPGLTHKEDMSHYLRRFGMFPSFNRPFFDKIREVSGFQGAQQTHGDLYSWDSNPRARIFAAQKPNSLWDMRNLMTSNANPLDPGHQISARMDLSPVQPIPNGGIDAKIINRCLRKTMQVQAISAPSHSVEPVFRWVNDKGGETWYGFPHRGLPVAWDFNFVQMTPTGRGDVFDLTACPDEAAGRLR